MKLLCLSLFLLLANLLVAQQPTLGLVLSGGGAKGLAHIGVLQELEKAGIYPDVVSGTSMGSIIGGLYAIGYDPAALTSVVSGINWSTYFSDTYPSAYIPIEERRRTAAYLVSFPLEKGKVGIPKGLLQGRKILTLLSTLSSPSSGYYHFDDFPLPFRAVATDIATGEAYVFSSGLLHQAIRASMAIPSIFSPVSTADGITLVDGLVVRNLPVQECLDMGAAVTIAVDVGTPLYALDELNSLLRILEQTASFGSNILNIEQRNLADIIIDPVLTPYTTLDYGAADSIIARGAASARQQMPAILARLDTLGFTLPMELPDRPAPQLDSFSISRIRFESKTAASARILEKLVYLESPAWLSNEAITKQIGQLYGSGFFQSIDFHFQPDETRQDQFVLVFTAVPAPDWRMRLSMAYDSDFEAAFLANLSGLNVVGKGSSLALDARISENPRVAMEYLLYNHTRPSIGIRSLAAINYYPGRIYNQQILESEFRAHHYTALLSAFSGLGDNRYLEIGVTSERTSLNPRTFSLSNAATALSQQRLFAEFIHETFDRQHFPLRGSQSRLYLSRAIGGYEQQLDGSEYELGTNLTFTARHERVIRLHDKMILLGELATGFLNHRRSNILNQLYLGRALAQEPLFFNAYGQRFMELAVSGFATASLGLRVEVGQENYISLHYQYGRYARSQTNLLSTKGTFLNPAAEQHFFQGFAVGLGSATIGGPVLFNAEYNPKIGRMNYNLHLGFYF